MVEIIHNKRIGLTVPLLFLSLSLFAQGKWSGNYSIEGGSNFKQSEIFERNSHSESGVSLGVKYTSDKFWLGTGLSLQDKFISTGSNGMTLSVADDDAKLDTDILVTQTPQTDYRFNLSAGLKLSDRDNLSFDFIGNLSRRENEKAVISTNLFLEDDPFNTSDECSWYKIYNTKFSSKWVRTFDKPGRELNVTATYNYANDTHETEWEKMKIFYIDEDYQDYQILKDYKIHQIFQDHDLSISSVFKEKKLGDISGLDADFHLDALFKTDIDHYDSDTLRTEIWRHGPIEDFNYFSSTISPTAHIIYSLKKYRIEAEFTPQFYLYRLNDASHKERIKHTVNPLGSINFRWNMAKSHSLSIAFKESISRPDYLKMCWFKRQGNYINEMIQGNVDLKSSTMTDLSLSYMFSPGKFHTRAELRHRYTDKKIESTYNNVDNFRVFTWINGGFSNTTAAVLNVGWNGKLIKTDITGTLNNYNGVSKAGNRTISSDYNLNGNLSFDFTHGWTASLAGRYQSKIKRDYLTMTQYIGCDARISKKFKNIIELYAEGRDLFDNIIEYGTISQDETQFRYEERTLNRRLIKLGLKINL